MKKVLIVYATKSGSTAEVAEFIGKELTQAGAQVDVLPVGGVTNLAPYDAVIVGGPMILGWHNQAVNFIRKNRSILKSKKVACFLTALSLTKMANTDTLPFPVFQDEGLAKPPVNPAKLSIRENYATVPNYLKPLMKTSEVKPVSVAFFAGKLDMSKLNFLHMLFVMLVIGATPGDYRNWKAVSAWTASLVPLLTS